MPSPAGGRHLPDVGGRGHTVSVPTPTRSRPSAHVAVGERYTLADARRIALAAQGLHRPRPAGPVTMARVQRVLDRVGLLQIDSVNVLARAHQVPVFSRLGPYDTALLDRATSRSPRRLMESWAHVASFVPPSTYRLLEWRRRADRARYGTHAVDGVPLRESPVLQEVRTVVAERGPITAQQAHALFAERFPRPSGEWGANWTVTKEALEYLFFAGEVAVAGRTAGFERLYDLSERVAPPDVAALPALDDEEAVRGLVEISARAHGIGTLRCLADYFRLSAAATARAVDSLVADGMLVPAQVAGWDREVYRHVEAALPRRATGGALLSPFDPLVFERQRLEELFGLRYRIEIYVPAARRQWGYYVLPFLMGEAIEALVDLKAARASGHLVVQAAHRAPGARDRAGAPGDQQVARALADELTLVARWTGLEEITLGTDGVGGDLVPALARELQTASSRLGSEPGTAPDAPAAPAVAHRVGAAQPAGPAR